MKRRKRRPMSFYYTLKAVLIFAGVELLISVWLFQSTPPLLHYVDDQTGVDASAPPASAPPANPTTRLGRPPLYAILEQGLSSQPQWWIPDVFHILYFGNYTFDFIDVLHIRSIYLNHGPEKIILHTDNPTVIVQNALWKMVSDIPGLTVRESRLSLRTQWGQPFGFGYFHACDVKRAEILRREGGVYIDHDVFILRPLRHFFKHEYVSALDTGYMSSMLQMSQPGARYLTLFLNSYRLHYNASIWFYNAGLYPLDFIVIPHRHLVADMGVEAGDNYEAVAHAYNSNGNLGDRFYAVHILLRYRHQHVKPRVRNITHPKIYTVDTIRNYDCALGRLFRQLTFGKSAFVGRFERVLSVRETAIKLGYPIGAKRPYPGDESLVALWPQAPTTIKYRPEKNLRIL